MTTTLEPRFEAILGPLKEDRDRLVAERTALIEQREAKDREIHRLDKVLRAAGLLEPQPVGRKGRKSKRSKVAPATLERVRAEVVKVAKRNPQFTQKDVKVEELSDGTISNAFAIFRDESFIRLMGRGGREVHGSYLYSLMEG